MASLISPERMSSSICSSFSAITASATAAATLASGARTEKAARSSSGSARIAGPKVTGSPSLVTAEKFTARSESARAAGPTLSSTTATSEEAQGRVPSLRFVARPSSRKSPRMRAWTSLPPWISTRTWRRKALDRMANCSSKASSRSSAVWPKLAAPSPARAMPVMSVSLKPWPRPTVEVVMPAAAARATCWQIAVSSVRPWLAWPSLSRMTRAMRSLPTWPTSWRMPVSQPSKSAVDPPLWTERTRWSRPSRSVGWARGWITSTCESNVTTATRSSSRRPRMRRQDASRAALRGSPLIEPERSMTRTRSSGARFAVVAWAGCSGETSRTRAWVGSAAARRKPFLRARISMVGWLMGVKDIHSAMPPRYCQHHYSIFFVINT